jgi:2,4-dienoyl-CoA reductase-like NADH-dependent reductase (Old Yellow Enzyme family)
MPGTDYLDFDPSLPQWHIEEAGKLGRILAGEGVDLLDISGGGLDSRQKITAGPGYQVPWAAAVKKAVEGTGIQVTAVGSITSGKQAQGYLSDGSVDAVLVGRGFLKDPNLVWHWADELDIDIHVAAQCKCLRSLTFRTLLTELIDGWGFGMTRTHRHKRH